MYLYLHIMVPSEKNPHNGHINNIHKIIAAKVVALYAVECICKFSRSINLCNDFLCTVLSATNFFNIYVNVQL